MSRPATIRINTQALVHNLQCVRQQAPASKIMAVVKANGYGCGLEQVALALNDTTDGFAVCCIEEAIRIREVGIQTPIVLLEGFFTADELPLIVKYDFQVVIHHRYQLDILSQQKLSKPIRIWLKVNTGMHRLGVCPDEFKAFYEELQANPSIEQPINLMTHFSHADIKTSEITLQQINLFNRLTKDLKGERSAANSAGILAWADPKMDWVRPGIMLYGVSPFADETGANYQLKPVMSFRSQLIAVNFYKRGSLVGYGGIGFCPEDMPIGVVAVGYGDGYPRHARNKTPVLVNGKVAPLIGQVSMDMITVDLRGQVQAKVSDPVELWGENLPVETVALCADTIGYELLTQVTDRVRSLG